MKKLFSALWVLSVIGCSTAPDRVDEKSTSTATITIYKNHAKGIDSIIGKKALKSFTTEYKNSSLNKAFAQSTSGAWNWKSNRTSMEHAKTSALIGCQRNNKKHEDLYPCKVIHLNNEWVE